MLVNPKKELLFQPDKYFFLLFDVYDLNTKLVTKSSYFYFRLLFTSARIVTFTYKCCCNSLTANDKCCVNTGNNNNNNVSDVNDSETDL